MMVIEAVWTDAPPSEAYAALAATSTAAARAHARSAESVALRKEALEMAVRASGSPDAVLPLAEQFLAFLKGGQ